MARYALCSVCGKSTRLGRARTCTFCGRYVCRKHRTNGLCPAHVNIMNKENADALLVQDNISHWLWRISSPIMVFFFIFSIPLMISASTRITGYSFLGISLIILGMLILISRVTSKRSVEILAKVKMEKFGGQANFCLHCRIALPSGTFTCPNCGKSVISLTGSESQKAPPSSSPSNLPSSYEDYSQPLPTPPPPPPPAYQQQHETPPPPPQDPYTSNQDINSIFEEIAEQYPDSKIEVTNSYDEESNSGFHICSSCGQRFAITGSTSSCPYCNKPLYGTR